ncbi:TIGR03943 family putative permease subunit [Actinomadura sp. HBU206391]|uniref:TIGR03943 family putative permease subunit n=1 Tax=Actinomadura sp. HBU206391 TaxID=2731692 RepID=UPI00164F453A|nr:TIGR03943 family protein [Actinomadura sp. HBU206391]MBC6463327.1 TIGR03943 family protein [Actinomadura sp. HBU206391]
MGTVVTKAAQNLLLILVGAAALWITVATDEYLNYVKPGFRVLLVAAAVALVVLGAVGVRRDWRDDEDQDRQDGEDGHGQDPDGDHDHGRGPRVAWLLCLPALAIFLIAPPALGSFTASRDNARSAVPPPPPGEGFGALKPASSGAPTDMTLGEFIGRSFEAQTGDPAAMQGVPVRLTGFATPREKGNWHLNRLRMSCCAGDAIALRVVVHGANPPPADSWVQVVGTWTPPTAGRVATGVHELTATSVLPIKKPRNAYER